MCVYHSLHYLFSYLCKLDTKVGTLFFRIYKKSTYRFFICHLHFGRSVYVVPTHAWWNLPFMAFHWVRHPDRHLMCLLYHHSSLIGSRIFELYLPISITVTDISKNGFRFLSPSCLDMLRYFFHRFDQEANVGIKYLLYFSYISQRTTPVLGFELTIFYLNQGLLVIFVKKCLRYTKYAKKVTGPSAQFKHVYYT